VRQASMCVSFTVSVAVCTSAGLTTQSKPCTPAKKHCYWKRWWSITAMLRAV